MWTKMLFIYFMLGLLSLIPGLSTLESLDWINGRMVFMSICFWMAGYWGNDVIFRDKFLWLFPYPFLTLQFVANKNNLRVLFFFSCLPLLRSRASIQLYLHKHSRLASFFFPKDHELCKRARTVIFSNRCCHVAKRIQLDHS